MKVVRLGDLCHIRIGRTPSRANPDYWGGGLPWATISDLGDDPLRSTRERITELAVNDLRMRPVDPGTLLYSFKLTIGKVAMAGTSLYTNEAIAALVPREPAELDTEYLRFALATVDSSSGASVAVKGRTLNSQSLSELMVPMVPMPNQRRIAAAVTGGLVALRTARRCLDAERKAAFELRSRFLADLFPAFERTGFLSTRIGDVASLIRGVTFEKSEASTTFRPSTTPILRAGNISRRLHTDQDLVWIPRSRVSPSQFLRRGDIAICMSSGSPAVVGKSALLESDFSGAVGAFCAIIRPTAVLPAYLGAWLQSPTFVSWRDSQASGANIQNLKLSALADARIQLPDSNIQVSQMRGLELKLRSLSAIDESVRAQSTAIEVLENALRRRAFEDVAA